MEGIESEVAERGGAASERQGSSDEVGYDGGRRGGTEGWDAEEGGAFNSVYLQPKISGNSRRVGYYE